MHVTKSLAARDRFPHNISLPPPPYHKTSAENTVPQSKVPRKLWELFTEQCGMDDQSKTKCSLTVVRASRIWASQQTLSVLHSGWRPLQIKDILLVQSRCGLQWIALQPSKLKFGLTAWRLPTGNEAYCDGGLANRRTDRLVNHPVNCEDNTALP